MTDQTARRELAELIVEALEVGSGKHERDIIDEIFDAFGINYRDLAAPFRPSMPGFTGLLRKRASGRLAEAAPSAAALLNELVRRGGRFVAMLDEVYDRLARHTATVSGTAETFRLQRAGVDEAHLTISPAFIEQVHRVNERLRTVEVGTIDEPTVSAFTAWDDGVFYGSWPLQLNGGGFRLADAVLNLAWITPMVSDRAKGEATWRRIARTADAARTSAERMVVAAERLVRARMAGLDMIADLDVDAATDALHPGETAEWLRDALAAEVRHYREARVLARVAEPDRVSGIDERSAVGLTARIEPVVLPVTGRWGGTAISSLASFAAMWRQGLYPAQPRFALEDRRILDDAAALGEWLETVRACCDDAAEWLTNDALVGSGTAEVTELIESIEEYLNLPLWRQRHLLYEVWVLCATLDACELSSWVTELRGLTDVNGTWVLTVGPTDDPVATLRLNANPATSLEVWREPNRVTVNGVLTPDVTISTPGLYRRDLVVVEAKDRQKMPLGRARTRETGSAAPEFRSALGVARRYAAGLRARVTWVCNHCDFRQQSDAAQNYGDEWTRVHVAAQFRPGNVPAAFAESVRAALAPPGTQSSSEAVPPRATGLVLMADVTSSMRPKLDYAVAIMREQSGWSSAGEFRVILYSDHGTDEPFLVCKLGPFKDLASTLDSVAAAPCGNGHDIEEALEDALQRCRELAEDVGPQHVILLTDAPPHAASDCPYGIDAAAEMRTMLDAGSQIYVASDWLGPTARTWAGAQNDPGFVVASLREIMTRQGGRATT